MKGAPRKCTSFFVISERVSNVSKLDVANLLGISVRQTRDLLTGWVADGWLEVADPSKRGRKYRLVEEYQVLLNQH